MTMTTMLSILAMLLMHASWFYIKMMNAEPLYECILFVCRIGLHPHTRRNFASGRHSAGETGVNGSIEVNSSPPIVRRVNTRAVVESITASICLGHPRHTSRDGSGKVAPRHADLREARSRRWRRVHCASYTASLRWRSQDGGASCQEPPPVWNNRGSGAMKEERNDLCRYSRAERDTRDTAPRSGRNRRLSRAWNYRRCGARLYGVTRGLLETMPPNPEVINSQQDPNICAGPSH